MKGLKVSLLALLFVFTFAISTSADDKAKKTTLKGNLVCGKCTLGITDGCSNVLQVEKDGKKMNYVLDDKAKREKYHKKICPPGSKSSVSVTGVVYKKGDRMHIKNPKVKVLKN